jgi:cysteinyl-tRNA synthetase
VDPDWPGNYQVKYWTTQWRTVAYAWCDSLIAAGFDGMYMDVVDEWGLPWAQANVTGGGATNAANAMVTLIQAIRTHAHVTKPSFKIWVNGGEELFAAATAGTYLACLDGMFKEQVCYANPSPGSFTANSTGDRNAERTMLRNATDSGKPVILIEYVTGSPAITDVKAVCATWGFGYYIADPNLDLNGIDTEGL